MFITLCTLLCTIQILTQECICLNLVDVPLPGDQSDKTDHNAPAAAPAEHQPDAPAKYEPDAPVPVKYEPDAPVSVKYEPEAPAPVKYEPDAPAPIKYESDAPVPGEYEPDASLPDKYEPDAPVPVKYEPDAPVPVKYERVIIAKYDQLPAEMTSAKPKRRYWLIHDDTSNYKVPMQPRVYEDEKDANLKNKIAALVEQTMGDTEYRMKAVKKYKDKHRGEAPYKAGFILSLVKKCKDVLDELFNVAVRHRHKWMSLEHLKVFELIMHTNVDTTNLLRQLVDVHVKHLNATNSNKKRVILI